MLYGLGILLTLLFTTLGVALRFVAMTPFPLTLSPPTFFFSGKVASTHSEYLGQAWTFRSEDNGSTPGVGKVPCVTTLVSKLPNLLILQIFLYYVLGIVNNICN